MASASEVAVSTAVGPSSTTELNAASSSLTFRSRLQRFSSFPTLRQSSLYRLAMQGGMAWPFSVLKKKLRVNIQELTHPPAVPGKRV